MVFGCERAAGCRKTCLSTSTCKGPELCSVTIHLRGGIVLGVTARDMLTAACDWLLARGASRHGFIDLYRRNRLAGASVSHKSTIADPIFNLTSSI